MKTSIWKRSLIVAACLEFALLLPYLYVVFVLDPGLDSRLRGLAWLPQFAGAFVVDETVGVDVNAALEWSILCSTQILCLWPPVFLLMLGWTRLKRSRRPAAKSQGEAVAVSSAPVGRI